MMGSPAIVCGKRSERGVEGEGALNRVWGLHDCHETKKRRTFCRIRAR
jgi:hypothetical protein